MREEKNVSLVFTTGHFEIEVEDSEKSNELAMIDALDL